MQSRTRPGMSLDPVQSVIWIPEVLYRFSVSVTEGEKMKGTIAERFAGEGEGGTKDSRKCAFQTKWRFGN